MTDGMTEKDRKGQLLDFGLSTKVCILVNPYTVQLKCYGEVNLLTKPSDSMLPRKVSRVNYIGACTENRHRWSRRVS